MATRLNIEALIADLGGASTVAKMTGVVRTAPYGWIKRRYISSSVLEKIMAANPNLDLNHYFTEVHDDREQTGGRA